MGRSRITYGEFRDGLENAPRTQLPDLLATVVIAALKPKVFGSPDDLLSFVRLRMMDHLEATTPRRKDA